MITKVEGKIHQSDITDLEDAHAGARSAAELGPRTSLTGLRTANGRRGSAPGLVGQVAAVVVAVAHERTRQAAAVVVHEVVDAARDGLGNGGRGRRQEARREGRGDRRRRDERGGRNWKKTNQFYSHKIRQLTLLVTND